jgi:predicted nucleic acid-binding protein
VILLDANVLVASLDRRAAGHLASRAVVTAARGRRLSAVLVPQVLLEASAVLTDGRRAAAPLTPDGAWTEIGGLAEAIPVIYPQRRALDELAHIMQQRGPRAQSIFAAFLVAQMRAAGIGTICTYNISDFTDYEGINPEVPDVLLARFGLTP